MAVTLPRPPAVGALSDAFVQALTAIVGARWIKRRVAELAVYDADALPGYRAVPGVGVFPGTREELIAVVRCCWGSTGSTACCTWTRSTAWPWWNPGW